MSFLPPSRQPAGRRAQPTCPSDLLLPLGPPQSPQLPRPGCRGRGSPPAGLPGPCVGHMSMGDLGGWLKRSHRKQGKEQHGSWHCTGLSSDPGPTVSQFCDSGHRCPCLQPQFPCLSVGFRVYKAVASIRDHFTCPALAPLPVIWEDWVKSSLYPRMRVRECFCRCESDLSQSLEVRVRGCL